VSTPQRSVVLGAGAALIALLLTAPDPAGAVDTLRGATGAPDLFAPVVAVLALAAWALAGWLLATAALTLLSRVPGTAGRAAAALGRRVAPAAVRRGVELALGLTVTASVLGAGPAAAATPEATPPPPSVAASAPASPVPAFPAAPSPAPSAAAGGASPTASPTAPAPTEPGTAGDREAHPALDWPVPGAPVTASSSDRPPTSPAAGPAPRATSAAALHGGGAGTAAGSGATRTGAAPTGSARNDVVVAPGDSLWRLAERDLAARTGAAPTAAQTAAEWPRWWAANRDQVGDDPDLVHPGTTLTPPAETPADPAG